MFWNRYGFAVAWALPLGIGIGAGLGLLIMIPGLKNYETPQDWWRLASVIGIAALAGGALALAALIGGAVVVLLGDRHPTPERPVWIMGGVMGAVAGVVVLVLASALINGMTTRDSLGNLFLYAIFTAIAAGIIGYAAYRLLRICHVRLLRAMTQQGDEGSRSGEGFSPSDTGFPPANGGFPPANGGFPPANGMRPRP